MNTDRTTSYDEIIRAMSQKLESNKDWLHSEECQFLIEIAMSLAPPDIRRQIEKELDVSDEEVKLKLREYEAMVFHDGAFHRTH